MTDRAETLDALLGQWRQLSRGDRQAIRRQMPIPHRLALDQALGERRSCDERSRLHGNQTARPPFSPWLATILQTIDDPDSAAHQTLGLFRPAVREALREAHARSKDLAEKDVRPSLLDLARSLILEGGVRR